MSKAEHEQQKQCKRRRAQGAPRMATMALAVVAFVAAGPTIAMGEVWSGLDYAFEKLDGADWSLEANQDRITDNVWLTRGDHNPLFNAFDQTEHTSSNPSDTEWAFSQKHGNPEFGPGEGAAQYGGLNFDTFVNSLDVNVGYFIVDRPAVVHLITDDIYIDILFDGWTVGDPWVGGPPPYGGFAYTRGVVPEPSSLALLAFGIAVVATRRRRKC